MHTCTLTFITDAVLHQRMVPGESGKSVLSFHWTFIFFLQDETNSDSLYTAELANPLVIHDGTAGGL